MEMLQPVGMDRDYGAGGAGDFAQKGSFPAIRLDQRNAADAEDRQNHSGETGAAADIQQRLGAFGDMPQNLCRIPKMAAPGIPERGRPDQIDGGLPTPEQIEVDVESVECFT